MPVNVVFVNKIPHLDQSLEHRKQEFVVQSIPNSLILNEFKIKLKYFKKIKINYSHIIFSLCLKKNCEQTRNRYTG